MPELVKILSNCLRKSAAAQETRTRIAGAVCGWAYTEDLTDTRHYGIVEVRNPFVA